MWVVCCCDTFFFSTSICFYINRWLQRAFMRAPANRSRSMNSTETWFFFSLFNFYLRHYNTESNLIKKLWWDFYLNKCEFTIKRSNVARKWMSGSKIEYGDEWINVSSYRTNSVWFMIENSVEFIKNINQFQEHQQQSII